MNETKKTRSTWRPSAETAEAAWSLLVSAARRRRRYPRIGNLRPWQRPADAHLVAALDAAILAGEDGRMLTTNLVFDALASRWSSHYRKAVDAGPARISYEMHADVLDASLHDLRSNGLSLVRLGALLDLVQNGCGLYRTERSPERGYSVVLTDETEALRAEFVEILAGDRATGGDYRRRGAKKRLLIAGQDDSDAAAPNDSLDGDETDADATYKVVAGWKYNVAAPGPGSQDIIRRLEAARLYLDVTEFRKEFDSEYRREGRVVQRRDEINEQLWDNYKVDVTKSHARPRGGGRSARQWAMKHLKKRDVPAVKALVEEYDDLDGQIKQVQGVYRQLREIDRSHKEIEIRSRYYKVANRRYQNADFWPPEVSGKKSTERRDAIAGFDVDLPTVTRTVDVERVASRRGQFFRVAAPVSPEERARREKYYAHTDVPAPDDLQDLVAVDVSSSQIQILAAFLGLSDLEALFKGRRYWDIVADRVWERDQDAKDDFDLPSLPHRFEGPRDPRLQEALKKTVMTWLYNASPSSIVETLDASPSEYGPGLGNEQNISLLLHDKKLKLHGIDDWFKPACRAIALQAWKADHHLTGLTFTDPFDKVAFRWNPVYCRLEPCAGSGHVKIYAKVPYVVTEWTKNGRPKRWLRAKPNADGDYPVDRMKLGRSIAPCLTHMLDAAFAGFVIRKLNELGVPDVVSIHDAFYVAEEAEPRLHKAVESAGEPWLRALGPVYDDLERYLGQDAKYGPWIKKLRQQWTERVARADWPVFRVGDVSLVRTSYST